MASQLSPAGNASTDLLPQGESIPPSETSLMLAPGTFCSPQYSPAPHHLHSKDDHSAAEDCWFYAVLKANDPGIYTTVSVPPFLSFSSALLTICLKLENRLKSA
jgi:hypothetical protein